jgi:RecG-like helicase
VVATIIPFDVQKIIADQEGIQIPRGIEQPKLEELKRAQSTFTKLPAATASKPTEPISHYAEDVTPIGNITWRKRAHVQGRVSAIKSAPSGSSPLVEVEVWDESGGVTLQFLGRREISGLDVGSELKAEGMVGEDNGQLIILNPSYEIIV